MDFNPAELPDDAQQRLQALNEDLKEVHRAIMAAANDVPALIAWSETMCLLVLKAHARAEHLEWRLSMLEEDVAGGA